MSTPAHITWTDHPTERTGTVNGRAAYRLVTRTAGATWFLYHMKSHGQQGCIGSGPAPDLLEQQADEHAGKRIKK